MAGDPGRGSSVAHQHRPAAPGPCGPGARRGDQAGGFDLGWRGQVKTGVRPSVPILPELAAEIATWEKRPGRYVPTETGKPFTRKRFVEVFREATGAIPVLTLHGLRATAAIRLKRAGLITGVISDIACRRRWSHAIADDKRESGKAALIMLAEHAAKKNARATSRGSAL